MKIMAYIVSFFILSLLVLFLVSSAVLWALITLGVPITYSFFSVSAVMVLLCLIGGIKIKVIA